MSKFDWGDYDETDTEFLQRNNWLFKKNPRVDSILNTIKSKLNLIKDWNRFLQYPVEITYSGYHKDNELLFTSWFKKPLDYHIVIVIKFSPDIRQVFVNYEHNYIEFDIMSMHHSNIAIKIVNFISNIVTQHVKSTYKEWDELKDCNTRSVRSSNKPSWSL